MFKIIVRYWLNGDLLGSDEDVGSMEEAMAKISAHDAHHRKHSHGHLLKILDSQGEVVHYVQGSPDPVTETYA